MSSKDKNMLEQFITDNILYIPCGATEIGNQIQRYPNKQEIEYVQIPDTVKVIKSQAFSNLVNLQYIEIPDSVTTIEFNAFMGCSQLSNIIMGDSVIELQFGAFSNCQSLKYIKLSEQLKKIESLFDGCTNLKNITLPQSINQIGASTFKDCKKLMCVSTKNQYCLISSNAFINSNFRFNNVVSANQLNQSCLDDIYISCNKVDDKYIDFVGDTQKCVEPQLVQYYKQQYNYKQYVQKCSQYYFNQQRPYQCSDQCPEEYKYHIDVEQFPIQCTQSCMQLKNYSYQFVQDEFCVEKCSNAVWYYIQDEQNKMCINSCQEQNFNTMEIFTDQCMNNDQIGENYFYQTKLDDQDFYYYIQNGTSCSQFQNIQNDQINTAIYQYYGTNQCTDCINKKYQIVDDYYCQKTQKHNKLSNGAIAGIVCGCVAFVVIIILIVFITMCKKSKQHISQAQYIGESGMQATQMI